MLRQLALMRTAALCARARMHTHSVVRQAAIAAQPIVNGERDVYARVRTTLNEAQRVAGALPGAEARALASTIQAASDNLNERFRLAVVGNFNLGKSSLINALLGIDVTPEGSDITTMVVHRINYGVDDAAVEMKDRKEIDVSADVAWLRDNAVEVIDTPGVGASISEHQSISLASVPHCDLLLLVTNPTSLLSGAAEHKLLELLGKHRSVIVVMNRIDQCADKAEIETIVAQAKRNALKFLHKSTPIVAVSAKLAKEAHAAAKRGDQRAHDELWARSRMGELVSMLTGILQSDERKYIKLAAPLELAVSTVHDLQTTVTKTIAGTVGVLEPLEACYASFDSLLTLFRKELQLEMTRNSAAVAKAARAAATALPSASSALLSGTRNVDLFAPLAPLVGPLRETLNGLVRDVQVETNAAAKTVAQALASAAQFVDAGVNRTELERIGKAVARRPEPGSEIARTTLATALEAHIDSAFADERKRLARYSLTRATTVVRLEFAAIQLLAGGASVTLFYAHEALGLTLSQAWLGLGATGLLSATGAGWAALRWRLVRRRVERELTSVFGEAAGVLDKALEKAVRTTLFPLREAVGEARDVLQRERDRLGASKDAVASMATQLERLRSEVHALKVVRK